MDLGLPPTLEVNLQDPVLDRFALVNPEVTKLQDAVGDVLDVVRSCQITQAIYRVLAEGLSRIRELEKGVRVALVGLQEDLNSLQESLPVRKLQLSNLEERSEVNDVGLDVSFSVDLMIETRNRLNSNHDRLKLEFARLWPEIVNLEVSLEEKELAVVRQEFVDLCTNLSGFV